MPEWDGQERRVGHCEMHEENVRKIDGLLAESQSRTRTVWIVVGILAPLLVTLIGYGFSLNRSVAVVEAKVTEMSLGLRSLQDASSTWGVLAARTDESARRLDRLENGGHR